MDAIDSLVGAARRAESVADAAAQRLATTDLPTIRNPDPTNPVAPAAPETHDIDGAGQLVTMRLAADVHHVTTAALRSAFSLYRDSIELLRAESATDLPRLDS
jgi:hypothetical protein